MKLVFFKSLEGVIQEYFRFFVIWLGLELLYSPVTSKRKASNDIPFACLCCSVGRLVLITGAPNNSLAVVPDQT